MWHYILNSDIYKYLNLKKKNIKNTLFTIYMGPLLKELHKLQVSDTPDSSLKFMIINICFFPLKTLSSS